MESLPLKEHEKFYSHQLDAMFKQRQIYLESKVSALYASKELYFGRIWGINEERGQFILRFKKDPIQQRTTLPRLNVPYHLCLLGLNAPTVPSDMTMTYHEFREKYTQLTTPCLPIYFLQSNSKWAFVGCEKISVEFAEKVAKALEGGKHPLIILAEADPPYQYLENLKNYVSRSSQDHILNIRTASTIADWRPTPLPAPEEMLDFIVGKVNKENQIIIQGPPGAGKTQLIAEICNYMIDNNHSICVTAMTNKALLEVALKSPLERQRLNGRICKTNLTTDEQKKAPGLKPCVSKTAPATQQILLSTFYSLSDKLDSLSQQIDCLIIEEASQAYLATISGFIQLAKKTIIIGDPMQMFPIVMNKEEVQRIHPFISNAYKGLETFACSNMCSSFKIEHTFRLTHSAAKQTSVFYNNKLDSVSELNERQTRFTLANNMPKNGETIMHAFPIHADTTELIQHTAITAINVQNQYPDFKIAVLSNKKKTVDLLISRFLESSANLQHFTIETIDRVQGLTVDVTFIVFDTSITFGLELNRFNVATSRAKRGTVIIARDLLSSYSTVANQTREFLNRTERVPIYQNGSE